METDVIIVGAGASGLMCAIEAGKRNRSVLVLDHSDESGRKIRISGGGYCNFTNINTGCNNYLSNNPHFCKSALARFTPYDFIAMLEKHRIKYYEKEMGQMFCAEGAGEIVKMLRKECDNAGVNIILGCRISDISKADSFKAVTNHGTFLSDSMVMATGGLSYPKLGATGFGHRIAGQFGLKVTELKPALVPFTFAQKDLDLFSELSGISIDAGVSCKNIKFRENILFTHKGLSGPAMLQISLYWNQGDPIVINLLPDTDAYELFLERRKSRIEMSNLLADFLPKRFARKWCELYIKSRPVCQYNDKELRNIAAQVHNWEIKPNGTEGYKTAEVTRGGVDTTELSSKTMEAGKVKGLYFIGEVVDVTGQLGGYNLQWAWSSGYVAGQYA